MMSVKMRAQDKEGMPLCRAWREGECRGMVGNTCPYRHFYTDR